MVKKKLINSLRHIDCWPLHLLDIIIEITQDMETTRGTKKRKCR